MTALDWPSAPNSSEHATHSEMKACSLGSIWTRPSDFYFLFSIVYFISLLIQGFRSEKSEGRCYVKRNSHPDAGQLASHRSPLAKPNPKK